jgi:parallel beta-helix repeat protein
MERTHEMKFNKLIFIIVIILAISFLFTGCGIIPTPTKGTISGQILVPPGSSEMSKDITGWVPAAGATVTVVDANGVTHTVTTDENGYYSFENIAVNSNTVVTATVTVDGKTVVLKGVIPQEVAEDEDYDSGTMTPESTALALVVEKLIDEGISHEDIDLAEIQASETFTGLVEQVTTVIEEEGNVTEDLDVNEGAGNTADEIINSPTPPTPPSAVPVTAVSIDQEDQTLALGTNLDLSVTITPANATNKKVSWTSDNKTVATVSPDGVVTAITEGATVITVTTASGNKTDTINITVSKIYNQTQKTSHNTIQDAIGAATAGDTILVGSGEFVEEGQIVIDKDLSIIGVDKETTIIKPNQNTGDRNSGDDRGWFLVGENVEFNLSKVTLNGEGHNICVAVCSKGSGTIEDNIFKNIKHSPYFGWGIDLYQAGTGLTIKNNQFINIERLGVHVKFGDGTKIISNTFTGNGDGDYLQYGIEVNRAPKNVEIDGNTFTYYGESDTDWGSGAIFVDDAFQTGIPSVTITNNTITNNEVGIYHGCNRTWPEVLDVEISGNQFADNGMHVVDDSNDTDSDYVLDLEEVFDSNAFPAGAVVIGNKIIVPETGTVYNKRTGDEYSTIQEAVGDATAEDTILLATGTYEGDVTITTTVNLAGTEDSLLVGTLSIEGVSGITIADINFKVAGNDNDSIVLKSVENISIESCEFDGDGWFLAGGNRAIQMTGANSDIFIDSCTFKDGYYVTVNGYGDNLTVQNSSIENCKSGINLQNGDNLVVSNTDISVTAQGKHNDTYCVRFANPATPSSNMTITGGEFTVDKAGYEAAEEIYHIPIIIRSAAEGFLDISNTTINGVIVDEYEDDLSAVLAGKNVVLVDEGGLRAE